MEVVNHILGFEGSFSIVDVNHQVIGTDTRPIGMLWCTVLVSAK